jgi:osmotically-inducible protein OsmY
MPLNLPIIPILLAALLLQGCGALVVGGAATGVSVIHDRRSAGVVIDDQNIEIKAINDLLSDSELSGRSNVSATSYNRVVLLTGQADNASLRQRAQSIVSRITPVKRVVNEIAVGPSVSLTRQGQDSWITSKVKLELLEIDIDSFDASRVKVVTENGVVFLMGLVTQAEAAAAVEKARWVDGVAKVVKVFEYI